jgi:ABC-type sugar transport system ATPase subunit
MSDASAKGPAPLIDVRNIVKHFGSVIALSGVSLSVGGGEVHCLLGDNGAGKSTLIKTLAGVHRPTSGEYLVEGKPVTFANPRDALDAGIATVYQDLALCDNLDIVQNMLLGHEVTRRLLLDEVSMEQTAKKTLSDLRVTTVRNIRQLVGSLSGGQRQAVAVAKAVILDAKLVIMDEPTAALGVTQTALVLELIKSLASQGTAVLVISHNLTDVFQVADRLAVLFLGRLVSAGPLSDYDTASAVDLMTTGISHRTMNGGSTAARLDDVREG